MLRLLYSPLMASASLPPPFVSLSSTNLSHSHGSSLILSFQDVSIHTRLRALKTGADGSRLGSREVYGSDSIRKPVVPPGKCVGEISGREKKNEGQGNHEEEEEEDDDWVDWEDKILEDTVPLVSFVRMILHSGTYESGDRLSPEHEKIILERLLPNHPTYEEKIGCGIDHIEVGYHPDFASSRCLFVVRKDGQSIDFSYWKCIKGLIRKKLSSPCRELHSPAFSTKEKPILTMAAVHPPVRCAAESPVINCS